MKNISYLIIVISLLVTGPFFLSGQPKEKKSSGIIAKGAIMKKAGTDYSFTEGPAVDSEGNVYFTDQPNDKIMKWSSTDGSISLYMEGAGRSNGLYFDANGNLLSCADMNNELWLIDKDKKITVLVKDFEGKKLNGPNDLWVDPKGGVYFTDPFYKRNYWTRTEKEIEKENVYYLSPDKKLTLAATDFVRPNGIVGSADGSKLYVSDINAKKTYVFNVHANGSLSDKTLFADLGSDGMTVDNRGNVYLTGKGVTVFNSGGKQIEQIPVEEPWTANVCFGGKDRKTLFITASKSVYTLPMKVKGVR